MRQIVVLSGKGGTGKTTLAAALVRLAGRAVAVDADVDAANLALLLGGEDGEEHPFVSGRRAVVDPVACAACGVCVAACRYDALAMDAGAPPRVVELACEGCGACAIVCPVAAVSFRDNVAGAWRVRRTGDGWLVHAALGVAQDSSGKLVATVRAEGRNLAEREAVSLVVIDGPPGVGCPVHAALAGVDELVAVTEPTVSGEHDLDRLLRLARQFGVPARVVVNKWDLAPDRAVRIERRAAAVGAAVVGRVPFDPAVPRALARGLVPLTDAVAPTTSAALRAIAERLGVAAGAPLPASSASVCPTVSGDADADLRAATR